MPNLCFIFVCFLTIFIAKASSKQGCLEKEDAISFLKTAADFLSKADEAYSTCNQAECSGRVARTYIGVSRKLIVDVRENFPDCSISIMDPDDKEPDYKPNDCSKILERGHNDSGVYSIWPSESSKPGEELQVYCDMETDGRGWTVIQRRGKFVNQQDFLRDWETYKKGFGKIKEEFWLGNENIRVLCHKGCEIRFDLEASDGTKRYAVYGNFKLSKTSYTIYIDDYSGDAGNAMSYQNNGPFSTKDEGNVGKADTFQGGWWYANSYNYANLNGPYRPGKSEYKTIFWHGFKRYENLARVEIKVRPKYSQLYVKK